MVHEPFGEHFLIVCLGGEGRFIITSLESMASKVIGASNGRIISVVFASSTFISRRLDLNLCGFPIPSFTSAILTRLFNRGDFFVRELLMDEYALIGLAGAEDDFLGDFLLGDLVLHDRLVLFEVTLLLLDLVETPGENDVGLLRADIGLFLFVVLMRMPFSKDLRAEFKASFKS